MTNFAVLSHEGVRLDPEQLLRLYRVSKLVNSTVELDGTLGAIVDAAHQLTGAVSTAIMLLDNDELVIRAGRGPIAGAVGERVPATSGIVGRTLAERHTCLVGDMHAEPDRARPDLDERSGLRSFAAAPLTWSDEQLGVLTIGSLEPNSIEETHAELLTELAEQAAAAVAHARAYTQEQARRVQLEEVNAALGEAQRQLIESEKQSAIGQLAHGIAHELNTPLGVIVSNLSVLGTYADSLTQMATASRETVTRLRAGDQPLRVCRKLEDDLAAAELDYLLEDLPALASESVESAKRMASIVRSVAVFASKSSDALTTVSIEEPVEAAVTLAWNELKNRGQFLRDYHPAPRVRGNTSELTQLFVHLLLNASQALESRSNTICVSIQAEGDQVTVRIADTGRGIPPEHLSRIFDPFFTTRAIGAGTGMGLAVCRGIVARHGGTIDVESELGRGTTVTVRLVTVEAADDIAA